MVHVANDNTNTSITFRQPDDNKYLIKHLIQFFWGLPSSTISELIFNYNQQSILMTNCIFFWPIDNDSFKLNLQFASCNTFKTKFQYTLALFALTY